MHRVLLLLPTTTYRTKAFIEAASNLGVELAAASELPSTMEPLNPGGLLTLDFLRPELAAERAAAFAARYPVDVVIPVDEDTAVAAAWIGEALNIPHNPPSAAYTAKNKLLMRRALMKAGLPVPRFHSFPVGADPLEHADRVGYPCVVKPAFLSTSRGVMRADNDLELVAACDRLEKILVQKDVARRGGVAATEVLLEQFLPGFEIAIEGLLTDGRLKVLAIFDKPDQLDGPFFEETIYVTPSRLTKETQDAVALATEAAARAMGLVRGPIHAELRINDSGPWVIEVAARSIGGQCSRTLRFGRELASLEELIIRHALQEDVTSVEREELAAAVMMIPIPRAGVLKEITGIEEARRLPGIEDVIITAHLTQRIAPPPEGASYLGFIFSRTTTASEAESAVREAHRRLKFTIEDSRQ